MTITAALAAIRAWFAQLTKGTKMATKDVTVTYPDTNPEHRIPVDMTLADKLVVKITAPNKDTEVWPIGITHKTASPDRQRNYTISSAAGDFSGAVGGFPGTKWPMEQSAFSQRFKVGKPSGGSERVLTPGQVFYINVENKMVGAPTDDASCFVNTGNPK